MSRFLTLAATTVVNELSEFQCMALAVLLALPAPAQLLLMYLEKLGALKISLLSGLAAMPAVAQAGTTC